MKHAVLSLLCAIIVTCVLNLVDAKIHYTRLDKDDRKLVPITEAFGFSEGGTISIKMSDYNLYHPFDQELKVDNSHFGFFLWPVESDAALEQDLMDGSECILKHTGTSSVFNFTEPGMQPLQAQRKCVAFGCEGYKNRRVAFERWAGSSQWDPHNGTLTMGSSQWDPHGMRCCAADRQSEQLLDGQAVLWVQSILQKLLEKLSSHASWMQTQRSQTSKISKPASGLKVPLHASLTTALLPKPFLGDKEKRILLVVVPLQVYANIAVAFTEEENPFVFTWLPCPVQRLLSLDWLPLHCALFALSWTVFANIAIAITEGESPSVMDWLPLPCALFALSLTVFANIAIVITEEESPSVIDWFTWRDVYYLVDIICCCAILFPIVWSIKHLREASQTDGKAARNLEKLTLFRQFYIMVVVYIYFTRIVVYLLKFTSCIPGGSMLSRLCLPLFCASVTLHADVHVEPGPAALGKRGPSEEVLLGTADLEQCDQRVSYLQNPCSEEANRINVEPGFATSTVQYEYSWTSEGAEQLATLAFYVWTAVRFRPQSNNPYLRLDASEIEL
ncbi:lung seven transmembrane receptor-domain-containing protein [Dunaliella salina]|uniref:Lung seven transmembrane receptor-domain-containing protein n=1 Tax=Dunaliella salina TaxID=3046 RepID=A0ACB6VFI1_DUNSA|nr:lung seven transmembrane receptor-domain-containing protein [Dunaliella salina]|eukprot:KAF5826811.1 lung seven transmembrane receptor-domain-containing protein [Dunaliella salina]